MEQSVGVERFNIWRNSEGKPKFTRHSRDFPAGRHRARTIIVLSITCPFLQPRSNSPPDLSAQFQFAQAPPAQSILHSVLAFFLPSLKLHAASLRVGNISCMYNPYRKQWSGNFQQEATRPWCPVQYLSELHIQRIIAPNSGFTSAMGKAGVLVPSDFPRAAITIGVLLLGKALIRHNSKRSENANEQHAGEDADCKYCTITLLSSLNR